ncbi:MAG: peptide chain release factor N(5)-glutamine methyltransferase [Alphaproteobacteria bacterium]|nr:peptide chain release factor N(5)-glutamine methyltransferase [Alphaproteobacteria bacterium]
MNISLSELLKNIDSENLKLSRRIIANIKHIQYEDTIFRSESILLSKSEQQKFHQMLLRAVNGEPLSKIIGKKYFWKHEFIIDENVLDPRPETELIIESVINHFDIKSSLRFLDMGTGSGCILLSLLSEFKNSSGIGVDISAKAINIAEKNREALRIDDHRVSFFNIDWNKCIKNIPQDIDIIVSNPPYIRRDEISSLDVAVRNYDPIIALDGGDDGLQKYREISLFAKKIFSTAAKTHKTQYVFLEVGYDQAIAVKNILHESGFQNISFIKDLGGINRVVIAH